MKYIRTILEILMLCGMVFFIYQYVQNTRELIQVKQKETMVKKQIQKEATEIDRKVDEKGVQTVIFDVTGNRAAIEEAALNTNTKGIIDTTSMALDIRNKQLKQILIVNSTLSAENLQLKRQLDAAKRPFYTFSGNGLDLKFTPPNEIDTNARAEFTANVNIKATQYWKRSWFLGAKKSILAVSSDNPMFKINGADFVEVEQKQPTFGLRVQASTSYNFESGSLGYGPAIRFDAGRFSFQGRYSKYPNDRRWEPSVNASFDLLRF